MEGTVVGPTGDSTGVTVTTPTTATTAAGNILLAVCILVEGESDVGGVQKLYVASLELGKEDVVSKDGWPGGDCPDGVEDEGMQGWECEKDDWRACMLGEDAGDVKYGLF